MVQANLIKQLLLCTSILSIKYFIQNQTNMCDKELIEMKFTKAHGSSRIFSKRNQIFIFRHISIIIQLWIRHQ